LDLEKDTKFIADSEHKRMIRAEVVNGDVLYTIAGSIGNACLVSGVEKANINQAIVRIKPGPQVLGQYLCDFLNSAIGKLQSRRIANGGVQLNINFSEVKALKILLPELDVQRQFVEKLAEARSAYKTSLSKADSLLAGIDEYLLSELGITLPPEPENTIATRIFTAQRKELAGWRFDPRLYTLKEKVVWMRYDN
jgi:type I restriction enzyme S subunit